MAALMADPLVRQWPPPLKPIRLPYASFASTEAQWALLKQPFDDGLEAIAVMLLRWVGG
jgi:hypothetical protein